MLLLAESATPQTRPIADAALKSLEADIAKYEANSPRLSAQAKAFDAKYNTMNLHDDQFDASDVLVSTAISMAAVAALTTSLNLLIAAWLFGAAGVFMGVCGFAGWEFHPGFLNLLS
jgi:hypothetical protein